MNPLRIFFKKISKKDINDDSVEKIFPDIFNGISGYNMRVGASNFFWPDYYTKYKLNYYDSNMEDRYLLIYLYKHYKFLESSLNVTSRFITTLNEETTDSYIYKNNLDCFLSLIHRLGSQNFRNTYLIKSTKLTFIVPVIEGIEIQVPLKIIFFFAIFCGIIIIFLFSAHIFKFPQDEWSIFNIYTFILGLGVNIDFRRSLR